MGSRSKISHNWHTLVLLSRVLDVHGEDFQPNKKQNRKHQHHREPGAVIYSRTRRTFMCTKMGCKYYIYLGECASRGESDRTARQMCAASHWLYTCRRTLTFAPIKFVCIFGNAGCCFNILIEMSLSKSQTSGTALCVLWPFTFQIYYFMKI